MQGPPSASPLQIFSRKREACCCVERACCQVLRASFFALEKETLRPIVRKHLDSVQQRNLQAEFLYASGEISFLGIDVRSTLHSTRVSLIHPLHFIPSSSSLPQSLSHSPRVVLLPLVLVGAWLWFPSKVSV